MDQELLSVVSLSLTVALTAIVTALPVAVILGYILAKWQFPGKSLLSALTHIPLVLPPVVTGYLLLLNFGPTGAIGNAISSLTGVEFGFRWTGAALAAGVMAFPLMVRPIRVAFEAVDKKALEVSKTLGASRWTAFRTISLPLALPGIIAGAMLGFAKALGEFGATITFVSNIPDETRTLSLAIYTFLQSPAGDHQAYILIFVSLLISFAAIYFSEWVVRRIEVNRGAGHD